MSSLTREKLEQASKLVGKSNLDVWLTFVRETAEGVVNWTIPRHTPAPISFTSAAAAAPKTTEAQVCKKNVRIGTLASVERTCMTPSEWAKQSDEQKQTYDELQGRKGSSNCISDGAC